MAAALGRIILVGKSITQSRRSRAGKSFEHHVQHLLDENGSYYDRESGDRRLDFEVKDPKDGTSLILSAKTTIRERWKQVPEGANFISLDRQISELKLQRMARRSLSIVVPEEDVNQIAQYEAGGNVLSFREFLGQVGKS